MRWHCLCRFMTDTTKQPCAVHEPVPNDVMIIAINPDIFHQKWSHILDHVSPAQTSLRQVARLSLASTFMYCLILACCQYTLGAFASGLWLETSACYIRPFNWMFSWHHDPWTWLQVNEFCFTKLVVGTSALLDTFSASGYVLSTLSSVQSPPPGRYAVLLGCLPQAISVFISC